MKKICRYLQYKPSTGSSWTAGIGLAFVRGLIRLVCLDRIFFPLTCTLMFSGHTQRRFEPVRIAPLIHETPDFLQASLPPSVEIIRHTDAPHDTILGGPTQVQQVVMNLCRNAADARGGVRSLAAASVGEGE